MKGHRPQDQAVLQRRAAGHLVQGDVFTFEKPVIPIKTGGRSYGFLSQRIQEQGLTLPDLRLTEARYVEPYILVALWSDDSSYAQVVGPCAAACLGVASELGLEELAWPVGGRDRSQHLWRAQGSLEEKAELLQAKGLHVPDWVFVHDRDIA